MIDPRNIVIAPPPAVPPLSEKELVFQRIKDFDARQFGPKTNKNERAVALILRCLAEGITAKSAIFRTLMRLGVKQGHIGHMLTKNDVQYTPLGVWEHDRKGIYRAVTVAAANAETAH